VNRLFAAETAERAASSFWGLHSTDAIAITAMKAMKDWIPV